MFRGSNELYSCTNRLSSILVHAAEQTIPKVKGGGRRKVVPWWNKECSMAVRSRNKAFRILRQTLLPATVLDYQRKRVQARKIIKQAKKKYWRTYCSTIEKESQLGEVWGMLKKMKGVYRSTEISVLVGEENEAVTEEEKAELPFQKAHSSENIDESYRRRRREIL